MSDTGGTLYLLCGLAFAGKSTLARAMAERLGCAVVAPDEINARRGLWGGDGVPEEEWARTHRLALDEVDAHLVRRVPGVVVDDTCCFRFLRDDYRRLAERRGYAVRVVVLPTPVAEIEQRMTASRRRRDRRGIDREVFDRHRREFEWPADDETPLTLDPAAGVEGWLRRLAVDDATG